MATSQKTADYLLEQMADAGAVTTRKMFGEYGVYCDGKIVALICDEQLYVKPTAAGEAFAGKIKHGPPYPGAKPYLRIPGERWDDADWLAELIRISAAALPAPTAKKKKTKSK